MVTAVHGHSQSQRSHQYVADLLGGNRISNRWIGSMKGRDWERAARTLEHWTKLNSARWYFTFVFFRSLSTYMCPHQQSAIPLRTNRKGGCAPPAPARAAAGRRVTESTSISILIRFVPDAPFRACRTRIPFVV
ncbi:hypothetical protein EVAR_60983_1 [Eumeta japonica]|uniref:Uncharacterized protein n=1 Tax=Eumeta variegata TaxID=151549 RepID=A0A4C1XSJ3_EUMVA|nr:hypothetical protein EVAR_60983_1 [Eumeta japonica]